MDVNFRVGKVGAKPWMAKEMARRIYKECRHLKFAGLMSDRVVPPHLTFAYGGPATELQVLPYPPSSPPLKEQRIAVADVLVDDASLTKEYKK